MYATTDLSLPATLTRRSLRQCSCCHTRFVGALWHDRCGECYRSFRPFTSKSTQAVADKELQHLRQQTATLQQQLLQQQQRTAEQAARLMEMERNHTALKLESERWKQRYYLALDSVGIRSKIPPEMLRRLLWLCHPDRHGDSETATATTAWLLAQRATS